jgi:DNA-binding Lrp family transcriptional regulator
MIHNVRLISSYLKTISSWPDIDDLTIKSIPSPYQIARKIKISANSSYKLWNLIFEQKYIKDLILIPEIFPRNQLRYSLTSKLPLDYESEVVRNLEKIPFIELLHTSNYIRAKKGSLGLADYMEIGNMQFLSSSDELPEKINLIKNAFGNAGLEFDPLDQVSLSKSEISFENSYLKMVEHIAYKSLRNFSMEEITENLNYSKKKVRRLMDYIVENRLISGRVIFNYKKIPNMITREVTLTVPEEDTNRYVLWIRSKPELRNNYIYIGNSPRSVTLTIFGETLEEIDNIISFLSEHFPTVLVVERFETKFFPSVKNYYRESYLKAKEKQ